MKEINRKNKNMKIKESLIATKLKRETQTCKVFKIKIQENKLSNIQSEQLKMMFVEAKWLINDILNWSSIEGNKIWDYKATNFISKKDKDMNDVSVELKYLGSQMKQSIISELISNVRTLSKLKMKGHKIGKLKFRKECKSINLKQYGITYKILSKNKIKIQGISKHIKVNGLNQILNNNFEYANAKLLNTPLGYYLSIVCYDTKKEKSFKYDKEIGIDLGCSTTVTFSNGIKFNASVQESDRLKKLQRKFSKQIKGSKNRFKTLILIKKEYQKMSNKKNDLANKIVHEIKKYRYIFMQDEQLSKWKINYGKVVQHSILGRIKSKLINQENVFVLDKWQPTTKSCYNCGQIHDMPLSKRVYECDCGIKPEDRDVHAAKNMIILGKIKLGQGLAEYTPVDIKTSVSNNKFDGWSRKILSDEDIRSLA